MIGYNSIKGVIFDVYNTLMSRSVSDFEKMVTLLPPDSPELSRELRQKAELAVKKFYSENRHLPWALDNNLGFWKEFYRLYVHTMGINDSNIADDLAIWSREPKSFSLFPDTLEVLSGLRNRGYLLGLLSNWDVTLKEFCHELGLSEYVDMILASDEVGIRKPDPRIFTIACERLGLPPASCLYVGDSLAKDVTGGNQAQLKTVWLNRTGENKGYSQGQQPTVTILNLTDLFQFLP